MKYDAKLNLLTEHKNSAAMKKILFFILTLSFVTGFAQKTAREARIEYKTDQIDYGTIEKGSDGYRTWEFTNTGTAPLIISRVRSSCGCTVAEKPEKPVMPGEKGKITVHYNTHHPGTFRKTVTLYTNATNVPNGVVVIKIKGKVLDPNNLDLNKKKEESPVFQR